jgi:hypothetical protein
MAGNMSNYLENTIINAVLRGIPFTSPTNVYAALYTSAPTDADTGVEVSGGGYARQVVTFVNPSNGITSNSTDIAWPAATGAWGVVTHVGIRDAAVGGNLLFWGQLPSGRTVNNGDIFKLLAASIGLTLD